MSIQDRRLFNVRRVTKGTGSINDELKTLFLTTVDGLSGSHNDMFAAWLKIKTRTTASNLSLNGLQKLFAKQGSVATWNEWDLGNIARRSHDFIQDAPLPSGVTFSSADEGSHFPVSGVLQKSTDIPRIDHSFEGGVWVNKGLLIEETRTNILLRSDDLFSTPWAVSQGGSVTALNGLAPDGTNTADTVTDADAQLGIIDQFITIPNDSLPYTYSVFVTKDQVTSRVPDFQIRIEGGTSQTVAGSLNTQTGAFVKRVGSANSTMRVDDFGLFWRVSVTESNNGTGNTTARIIIFPAVGNSLGAIGPGAQGSITMWGHQFEQAAVASSYLTTFSTTKERVRDEVTVPNFDAQGFNDEEGTIFLEWDQIQPDTGQSGVSYIASINDGTTNNAIDFFVTNNTGKVTFFARAGGVIQWVITPANIMADNKLNSLAFSYKNGEISLGLNGFGFTDNTGFTLPIDINTANLGSKSGFGDSLNGRLATFDYFNYHRPQVELAAMTAHTA